MLDPNENSLSSDTTTVAQVDVNLDELFGTPGAESIMLPGTDKEEEKVKTVFSNDNTVDLSFIEKPGITTPEEKKEVEETIAELDNLISLEEDAGNKGRPKVDKSGLYELAQKMIEEGSLVGFDDDKALEDYTTKDFRELFEANFQERENKIRESTPKEFFNALPEELQIAAKYVADGGQDLKGLFRTLAQVEEMIQLDPTNEYDQAEIARQYLYATGFGTPEEIEAEITDWSDLGKLDQKANQFKPKLDRMQEEIVARQLAEQEKMKLDYATMESEKNRQRDILVAEIRAAGYGAGTDLDLNQQSDYQDAMKDIRQTEQYQEQTQLERMKETNRGILARDKNSIEREKIQAQKEIADKQLQIARENKNKFDKKEPTQKKK
jgi:hypothetical protein